MKTLGFVLWLMLAVAAPCLGQESQPVGTTVLRVNTFNAQVGTHEGATPDAASFAAPKASKAPLPFVPPRPGEFKVLMVGESIARVPLEHLPIRIHIGDPGRQALLDQAMKPWNSAGLGTLFVSASAQEADLTIDWTGEVSEGARAETRLDVHFDRVIPAGIRIRPGRRSQDSLARSLSHELGHVIGLGHSSDDDDLMGPSEHRSGKPALSQRDQDTLLWLYSQPDFFPVLGNGPVRDGVSSSPSKN
ncbi:MAG: matrixin family metalloprotease [Armatimonadetes bacterium]|nr:matrixin family metalloprotease [Armatimonadota bacterium]